MIETCIIYIEMFYLRNVASLGETSTSVNNRSLMYGFKPSRKKTKITLEKNLLTG